MIPARQKIFLSLTILAGLSLFLCYNLDLWDNRVLGPTIMVYGWGIPFTFLVSDLLIDLNNKKVFLVWLIPGVVLFVTGVSVKANHQFKIIRSSSFISENGINSLITDTYSSSFKSLLLFLIAYWLLNNILKKNTGNFIVNTFKQHKWHHDTVNRKISGEDVLINLLLFAIIMLSCLFKFGNIL